MNRTVSLFAMALLCALSTESLAQSKAKLKEKAAEASLAGGNMLVDTRFVDSRIWSHSIGKAIRIAGREA